MSNDKWKIETATGMEDRPLNRGETNELSFLW
jgi:hypothetical protein